MALTDVQEAIRDGKLQIAQLFAIGGELWTVRGLSGDDVTAPIGEADLGTVRLWIRKIQPTRLERALAGANATITADLPRARWAGIGEIGEADDPADIRAEDLEAGQKLTSQENSSYRFVIKDIDLDAGYVGVIVDRI